MYKSIFFYCQNSLFSHVPLRDPVFAFFHLKLIVSPHVLRKLWPIFLLVFDLHGSRYFNRVVKRSRRNKLFNWILQGLSSLWLWSPYSIFESEFYGFDALLVHLNLFCVIIPFFVLLFFHKAIVDDFIVYLVLSLFCNYIASDLKFPLFKLAQDVI